jgi:hypothetical protein
VELRRRTPALRRLAALALALLALGAVAGLGAVPAQAKAELVRPSSQVEPPPGYRLTAKRVTAIAWRAEKVRAERARHRAFTPVAYTRGPGRWQVSYYDRDREVAQVKVDDLTGAVLEQWTGSQVAWTMARGYQGAFGRKLNAPYVWLPLCLLFLAPFIDPRRPLRMLHLDLLVLLSFGVSHVFFNRGEIDTSVPLVYPVLAYLLARLLWVGLRARRPSGTLIPLVPAAWLAIGIVLLVGFRVGLNVVDSNVIDVGYGGVIGADRVADGDGLYGPGFHPDVEHGDTYGAVTYLSYVPFEQALPWSGRWDDLPAAHGAALAFDLLTLAGLVLLGRRLRPGRAGRDLGLALGFAWASYPYALFALETNSNDSIVALFTVLAMLALTLAPAREKLSTAARAAAIGLGAAAKFAPLVLAPLFATAGDPRPRRRTLVWFAVVVVAVIAAAFLPFLPDDGPGEIYDRTVGYQASRPSPFSLWGQVDQLGWLQTAIKVAAAAMAVVVAFVPRTKTPAQVAALAAAVLIALQLGVSHWFYLYVVWFAPLALVAVFMRCETGAEAYPPAPGAADTATAGRAVVPA